eukprot:m.57919 g.57919  ORF g.57919 m.57919 type:complete len:972 (-) comp11641_c1_seq1:128-3043(-)
MLRRSRKSKRGKGGETASAEVAPAGPPMAATQGSKPGGKKAGVAPDAGSNGSVTHESHAQETASFKVKNLGETRVDSPDGSNTLMGAIVTVKNSKTPSHKSFLIVSDQQLILVDRKAPQLANQTTIPFALVTYVAVDSTDPKRFGIIYKTRTQQALYCLVLAAKSNAVPLVQGITSAVRKAKDAAVQARLGGPARSLSLSAGVPDGQRVPNPLRARPASMSIRQGSSPSRSPQNQRHSMHRATSQPLPPDHVQAHNTSAQRRPSTGASPRRASVGASTRRPSIGRSVRRPSMKLASGELPTEGVTYSGIYMGYELPVQQGAFKQLCQDALRQNSQRWQKIRAQNPKSDGERVDIIITNYSIKAIDKNIKETVQSHFIKHIAYTSVVLQRDSFDMFAYVAQDDNIGRTVIHLFRTASGVGDLLTQAIGKAFQFLDKAKKQNPFQVSDPTREKPDPKLFKLQIHRADLTAEKHIGAGEFGDVYRAIQVVRQHKGDPGRRVRRAVKMLRGAATESDKQAFIGEAHIMLELASPHLVRMIGVAIQQKPWLCVLEFMAYGDLKTILVALKEIKIDVNLYEQLDWAEQLASGMAFMAEKRLVHMDLAARNCMMTTNNVVKIGDFGLTQRLDDGCDYFILRKRLRLPLKWVAIEGMDHKIFSEASDVWSYGVLLWEIFTYGVLPYPDIEVAKIQVEVRGGLRLSQPENCPDDVQEIMASCWLKERRKRPTFKSLEATFHEMRVAIPQPAFRDIGAELQNRGTIKKGTTLDPAFAPEPPAPRVRTTSSSQPPPDLSLASGDLDQSSQLAPTAGTTLQSSTSTSSTDQAASSTGVPDLPVRRRAASVHRPAEPHYTTEPSPQASRSPSPTPTSPSLSASTAAPATEPPQLPPKAQSNLRDTNPVNALEPVADAVEMRTSPSTPSGPISIIQAQEDVEDVDEDDDEITGFESLAMGDTLPPDASLNLLQAALEMSDDEADA